MDLEQLAQATADSFNDRSYRDNAKDTMAPDVLIVDKPTNQEMRGSEAYVQYSDGFVNAIPDLKGTVIENKQSGNKVTSRVRGQGHFTGTMVTPQGSIPGHGKPVEIEYQIEQEFNDDGKVVRFAIDYDMQDFMRQLGAA
jgi:predicted ester cyclase